MDLRKWKSLSNGNYAETSASLILEDGSVIENDYDNITGIHNKLINYALAEKQRADEAEAMLKRAQYLIIAHCRRCPDKGEPCGRCEALEILGERYQEIEERAKGKA